MYNASYSCQIAMKLEYSLAFFLKMRKYKYLMKIRPLWESSCPMLAEGLTDGRIDMTKLRVSFRNFSNAPKNRREILDVLT
jgi:hypothetical protein